ncbi:MAG: DUF389 domain-containing protein [Butyricicoccus porcorum]
MPCRLLVAIATALMPPLCTAGYGLATMQPRFIFGAFYLFCINIHLPFSDTQVVKVSWICGIIGYRFLLSALAFRRMSSTVWRSCFLGITWKPTRFM